MTIETQSPFTEAEEPLLNTRQLIAALGLVLPRAPCRRTLRRWRQSGMPYLALPASPQVLFLLSAVRSWILARMTVKDLRKEAVDKSFTGSKRGGRKVA